MDDYALAVTRDALYTELWRACAGPLVAVPRPGDLVFYFPQGHIEQVVPCKRWVEASMNQISGNQTRLFDLPSKLLCRVLNVELKVETDTDDVYAQIVLMPETIEEENEVVAGSCTAMTRPTAEAVKSFCKTLTPTDISSGGLCVPRRHANECLPPLVCVRYEPVASHAGTSGQGSAWYGVALPAHLSRTSPTEFIVPYDQYMESVKSNGYLGMRFSMKFEGEKVPEQRYTGTIVDAATKMDIDSAANDCRPLRPRLVVYTASSSSSSGSLSTTYTSGSSLLQSSSDQGGSSPTATLSMSLVEEMRKKLEHVQFPWLELVEEERDKTREHIKSLVQQFFTTSNSALVLERWFSDLGVSWVLTITDDDIFRRRPQYFARSWIAALAVIQMFIFAYLDGNKRNQEEGAFFPCSDSELFARFLLATFLKILHFVDAIVTPLDAIDPASIEHHTLSSSMELSTMDMEATEPAEERLQALIGVRDALSSTSEQIQLWPHCTPFLQSGGIIGEVSNLLSAKLSKLDEIVWDTVDEIRTSLTDTHGLESQTSPDIHLLTRSVTNCIKVLSNNYGLVHQIVSKAASHGKYSYVPEFGNPKDDDAFAFLIMEMISCLQEKLLRVSQTLPDQSLRFLFLLNNTYFIWQQLHPSLHLESHMLALTCKIDEHIRSYVQASWEPVLSCLHDPTPLCLGRYSPLAKFKLQFHKTSTAQKLWRVPDPEMRRRLRTVIINKVNSVLTKYLEDYDIITPGVTPQEIEEILQETFEG
ncbi:hypothetical protein HU200_043374 [Digitaria exilis]|uniref:Exocyst subunit Exo70 family protein n=1 Tax=Digitaria exilis TaxID=1010633 RepID=A0A835BEI3_9POAL|nr:hypothetical protein HU200_043374 [Digitaria exilis]